MLSAAQYFNMPGWDASDQPAAAAGPTTEPSSNLSNVEHAATGAWHEHPGIALFGVVLVTAVLVAHSTRPVAGARVEAKAGPAKGDISGEI